MANFHYTARLKDNRLQEGAVSAGTRTEAIKTLRDKGLSPLLIREEKKSLVTLPSFLQLQAKVKARDMVIFTRELATMINAGVPIAKALSTLHTQSESPTLKKALVEVASTVESGSPLSDALEKYPKIFSEVYVNMVRAGESGGILDKILDRLAVQVEKDAAIKSKVKGALIYPSVIMTMTFGAFIFLMTGIVPKLKGIFDESGAQLPIYTKIMLNISTIMQKHGLLLLLLLIIGVVLFLRFTQQPKGKMIVDSLLLKSPIFGKIILKVNVAQFARTFSSLTGAGVSVLEGLKVTAKSLNNSVIRKGIDEAAKKVRNGMPISEALEVENIFPAMITQMTAVGEETGQVDAVLAKVADFYEDEVDRVISSLTSVMEPLIIILLGGMVGLIAASVFGPISQLTNVVE